MVEKIAMQCPFCFGFALFIESAEKNSGLADLERSLLIELNINLALLSTAANQRREIMEVLLPPLVRQIDVHVELYIKRPLGFLLTSFHREYTRSGFLLPLFQLLKMQQNHDGLYRTGDLRVRESLFCF